MMFGVEDHVEELDWLGIPDDEVICNGCNGNIYSVKEETFGWLIYLGKRELQRDESYDFYCDECTARLWKDAKEVKLVCQ
jgi:hypothetical protein